jgi:CheY-like chemotaxis protein
LAENRMDPGRGVVNDADVSATVLVVDDNPGFRSRARRWLEDAGYVVVAEAGDGPSALKAVDEHRPELVLLDVHLPGLSGLTVAERLAAAPDAPVVVLTSSRDAADFGDRLARSGAQGFVPKAELSPEALSALI